MEFKCLESINSLYVQKTKEGYLSKPCCAYEGVDYYVNDIKALDDNPYINNVRKGFKTNWKENTGCQVCIDRENSGLDSKRLRSLTNGKDRVNWDLRPGNTCNLKCTMCSVKFSSKWNEDVDVLQKFQSDPISLKNDDTDLNWDWLYEQIANKAKSIYFAGGEPFYMKNVQKFLYKLSLNDWNTKNTTIVIQTNGVSNTPKLLDILSRFDKIEFSISIDGWKKVNELVRFPTKHETFIKNTDELVALRPQNLVFNVTAQAMNFPNIEETMNELKSRYKSHIELHQVQFPSYLQINALKPSVIDNMARHTSNEHILSYTKSYCYDETLNKTMIRFLHELDKKRGTNSLEVVPWCFVEE